MQVGCLCRVWRPKPTMRGSVRGARISPERTLRASKSAARLTHQFTVSTFPSQAWLQPARRHGANRPPRCRVPAAGRRPALEIEPEADASQMIGRIVEANRPGRRGHMGGIHGVPEHSDRWSRRTDSDIRRTRRRGVQGRREHRPWLARRRSRQKSRGRS